MTRILGLILALWLCLVIAVPAEAATCKNYHDRKICILNIKRSAKYPWEYRVVVSVDDIKRPLEVYDCRDRLRVQPDGHIIPFSKDETGTFICSFFKT
jgi:hypothetical protein